MDGKAAFDGEAKVLDGNGKEIALDSALAFVPASPGIYTAQFRAKDSAGNFGEWVSYEFTVTAQDSSVQWNLLFPVYEGTVPQGTEVILPSAEAVSSSATEFTAALAVMLEVKAPDGSSALSQSAAQTSAFAFDQAGTYKVIYTATDYDGTVYSSETSVTVAAGDKVSREVIAREYLVSESLYLPQATQGSKQLESVAIAPDGSRSDFPKILLDSAGVWTIRYTDGDAVVFEEYIRVRNSVTEMWTTKSGVDLTAGAKTPDYYDFEAYGMEIAASLTSGEAFYNRAVNLDGRSKDDKLLEFLVTPSNEEQLELDRLEIVIRDAYDQSNYITIGFEPNMWGYRQLTTVYVSLSTGQTSSAEFHMSTTLYGKFTGGKISTDPIVYDPTITKPFSLYWDGEENAIYLSPSRTDLNKAMLADLDDPATFGVGNEWQGFTTGEAEIGFVFREINDTAHIIVTEFDGMKYGASSFDDVTAPTLVLSEEGQGAVGLAGCKLSRTAGIRHRHRGRQDQRRVPQSVLRGRQPQSFRSHDRAFRFCPAVGRQVRTHLQRHGRGGQYGLENAVCGRDGQTRPHSPGRRSQRGVRFADDCGRSAPRQGDRRFGRQRKTQRRQVRHERRHRGRAVLQ